MSNRITQEDAIATLQAMFSHMDAEVLLMVLESNGILFCSFFAIFAVLGCDVFSLRFRFEQVVTWSAPSSVCCRWTVLRLHRVQILPLPRL
jgi:hypothetical protein